MNVLLSVLFFVVGSGLAYWFWIRPILKARPQFSEFYEKTESWWAALTMKLNTIKTKLVAAFGIIASIMVGLHDFIIPIVTGIEWTPITSKVPAAVWPFVSLSYLALISWLRTLTTAATAEKIVAVEHGVITADQAIKADDAGAEVAVMTMKGPA